MKRIKGRSCSRFSCSVMEFSPGLLTLMLVEIGDFIVFSLYFMLSVVSRKVQNIPSNFWGVQVRTKVFKSIEDRRHLAEKVWLLAWVCCGRGPTGVPGVKLLFLPLSVRAQCTELLPALDLQQNALVLQIGCEGTVWHKTGLTSSRAVHFHRYSLIFCLREVWSTHFCFYQDWLVPLFSQVSHLKTYLASCTQSFLQLFVFN